MEIAGFITVMLTAMLAENVIFANGLGTSKMIFDIRNLKTALKFGVILTFVTVAASPISYYINSYTKQMDMRIYMRGIFFAFGIAAVYGIIALIMRYTNEAFYRKHRLMLSIATFNSSVHGALVISAINNQSLADTVVHALGSGLGFTLALFIIYNCKRRLILSNVPSTFRGLPITLVYIGILSLAIYGLV